MALYTEKLIMTTFQEMLEEMPFDKITVVALVKRAGISHNTFYYRYRDIYALFDTWFQNFIKSYLPDSRLKEWKSSTKDMLYTCCKHPNMVYHVFDCLSRDHMERYIFSLNDDVFFHMAKEKAEGYNLADKEIRSIAAFCRYAYTGFVLHFFWNHMEDDIDESVDRLGILFDNFLKTSVQKGEC